MAGKKARKPADGSYSNAWRNVSKIILRPGIRMMMRLDWHGQENIPSDGPVLLAANHLSYMDIFAVSLFADSARRYPVFLAKSISLHDPGGRHDHHPAGPAAGLSRSGRRGPGAEAGRRAGRQEQRQRDLLPRGDGHQGSRAVAHGRQDRRRPAGAGERHPGRADRALGRAADPALRQVRAEVPAAQDRAGCGRAARRPLRVRRPAAHQPGTEGRHRQDHDRRRRACSAGCVACRRRRSSTTRPSPAGRCARTSASWPNGRRARPPIRDRQQPREGRGTGRRGLGHDVRPGPVRRRNAGHAVVPPVRARRGDQHPARVAPLPARHLAASPRCMPPRTRRRRWRAPRSWCWRSRRRACGRTSPTGASCCRPARCSSA